MIRVVPVALVLALSLLAARPAAAQETAYVTDVLRLGLHNAPDTSDRAFRSLESGQQMQVLSRDRLYAQVRLPDGTEGYVKAAYLVDEKPARLIVDEAQSETAAVRAELQSVRDEYSSSAERIASLQAALDAAEQTASTAQAQLDEVSAENADYRDKMKLYGFSLPWPIALGAMLLMLVLGFVLGFWWIDSRSRARHGGFRIY